jgi:hypothetical protein
MIESALVKFTGNKAVQKLGSSDASDIPKEILDILGRVDYQQLQSNPEAYNQILDVLSKYISVLPQKGN